MPNIQLRPYQIQGIRDIFDAWNPATQNKMNVLFQMPTGTGKTTVFSEIVRRARIKDKKVLIVVHRKELVEQIVERLSLFDVSAGIISGDIPADRNKEVQVATIQTLSKREYPEADIIIIDECHHAKASTYKKLWDIYPQARFLGVTATPIRLNGEGFSELFEILINCGQLSDFVKAGYLVPIRHFSGMVPDLSSVSVKMNDYAIKELGDVMKDDLLMADLVNSYFAHANGKKMIIFAVNVEHSQRIVQEYREAGISAEHLDANTPKTQREQILRNFKEGRTRVLSNVDIVSEGFDVPDCEAVQLARPTKSLALYLQQVGRCMRPAPGKSEGIVLDNAALWTEHGLSQQNRKWTLEGKKKKKRRNSQYPMDVVYVEDGVIRQPAIPEEVEGMRLLEMTQEMDDLLLFERFLEAAWDKGDKPIRAFMQLKDKLLHQDRLFTAFHLSYIIKRVYDYPEAPKKGLWYYTAIENNIDYKLIKKAVETYAYT